MTHHESEDAGRPRLVRTESWSCFALAALTLILVAADTPAAFVPLAAAFALFAHLGRRAGDRAAPRHALMAALPLCLGAAVVAIVRALT